MKLYYHKTDGGAEYLTSSFIECPNGHKEGSFDSDYIVRIDGIITSDAELTVKEKTSKKHHNQFVRCIENIQDLSGQGLYEYVVMLGGGLCGSYKTIKYNPKTKKFKVHNHIDDSTTSWTAKELMDKKLCVIGEAMQKRSLIAIID